MDHVKYEEDAVQGELWWKRPIKVHRDVGPDSMQVICPTTVGLKCPICNHGAKRRKEGAEWDELKEIFPKDRTLFYIVPVDAQDCEVDYEEGTAHILDQSDHLFLEFLDEEVKRDIDNEDFPNPYDGLSLRVYFRSRKLGKQKFAETSKIDFEERDEQYDDEFLDSLPSLDDVLIVKDYKELEALYFGMEGMDDEDLDDEELEEEEEVPRKRSRKPASRKPSRRKPVRDEDPEEEEDEEPEEEEEPPKRTRKTARKPAGRKTSRKPKEEEEEPEDVDEEPEEEEKPRRRSRRASHKTEGECPYGHVFGEDNNQFDDCDVCNVWEDCKDASEV
jgi:hypothetical protein